jgi:cell division protein FtsW
MDRTLVFSWLLIIGFGTVMVASASVAISESLLLKHGFYLMLGFGALVGTLMMPLEWWRQAHRLALLLSVFLCGVVLIPFIGIESKGAQRWIGFSGFSIQPAELSKLLLLVYLAGFLHRFNDQIAERPLVLLRPLVMLAVPALLLLMQPDFGTVVVIATVAIALVFMAGARLRHFLLLVVLGASGLAALAILEPYRMQRLTSFLNPWEHAFSSGYQLTQALIAFGRGEVFGLGLGEGIQKLSYLPEAHNDFIFAVIAEELGLVGCFVLIALFALLVIRIFRVGRTALLEGNYFGGYLAYGVGLMLGIQFLINLGVNTGVLPTKGLTLPFVSYGGNSLMVSCAMIGLVLRLQMERGQHG